MYGKRAFIKWTATAFVVFMLSGFVFDRDLFLNPFLREGKEIELEKALVLETIRTYDNIFADFYASGGTPTMLNEFPATKAIRHGVFRDIGFIRDSGRVLVYDLAAVTPVDIRIVSYKSAEAVVFEEWNYLYQDKADRKQVTRMKGIGRGFRYGLIREHRRWVVRSWDPVDVEDPQMKESRHTGQ